jgi:hypothetical protein
MRAQISNELAVPVTHAVQSKEYMDPEQHNYENGVAHLPLSDGSFALLTPKALGRLEDEFGILSARLKKGAAGCSQVVAQIRTGRLRTTKEIAIRDLLAVFVYFPARLTFNSGEWRSNENRGQSYFLADGDARNLMPGNFTLTDAPVVANIAEKKTKTKKISAQKARPTNALPIEVQEALLDEVFPKLRAVSLAILRPESPSQGEEIAQDTALSLLQQIRAGACHAVSRGQLFAWVFSAVKTVALRKLNAIQSGVCKDVDHDRAAIRLLRVKRLNGKMREHAGLSVEQDHDMLGDINMADLARKLEAEASEKAQQERQRRLDEGRTRRPRSAASEVQNDEPENAVTDEDDFPDDNGDERADFDREDFRQRLTEAA